MSELIIYDTIGTKRLQRNPLLDLSCIDDVTIYKDPRRGDEIEIVYMGAVEVYNSIGLYQGLEHLIGFPGKNCIPALSAAHYAGIFRDYILNLSKQTYAVETFLFVKGETLTVIKQSPIQRLTKELQKQVDQTFDGVC